MAEVLVQFDEPFSGPDGQLYIAQICGAPVGGGLWEGWVQFVAFSGGVPFRTKRETEQLSKGDLRYWAAGLGRQRIAEQLYFTLKHIAETSTVHLISNERVIFDSSTISGTQHPLDPFAEFTISERYLREKLVLLSAVQLKEIISNHNIPDYDFAYSVRSYEEAMIERIVAAAQQRAGINPRPIPRRVSLN